MTQHELKVHQSIFDAINNDIQTFLIRRMKYDFKVGDTLKMYCINDDNDIVTVPNYKEHKINVPLRVYACVTYILTHDDNPDGIPEGYCVMSIRRTG